MKTRQLTWLLLSLAAVLALLWLINLPPARSAAAVSTGSLPPAEPQMLAHTKDITFTPAYTAYLPSLANAAPLQPAGIYGHVTYEGLPLDGVPINLQYCTDYITYWSCYTADTFVTQAGGLYRFMDAATLSSGHKYVIAFSNNPLIDQRFLDMWRNAGLYAYTAGQTVAGGDIELSDIVPLAPPDGANVSLPVTFQWQPRPGAPTDSYSFELYKLNGSLLFHTPQLGYTGSYTLNSLPVGFTTGEQYGWYIYIYGPGDSYGYSRQYPEITFH